MIKNFFKIAFRGLKRNKAFSVINIGGLAIGMASAILILLWIQNEVSYDRFHGKLDRLYQVWSNDLVEGSIRSMTNTPEVMAPTLKNDYPEVEEASRVQWTRNLLSSDAEKKLLSTGAVVDAGFLTMFTFPLVNGNVKTVLSDPHAIVLTQKLSKKIFNSEDVVGRTVRMGNSTNYTVTGILKDFPNNTQFDYQYFHLMFFAGMKRGIPQYLSSMEKIFKKYNSAYPFEYNFTDEDYAGKFADEQLTGTLASLFALLTIFISCLGLFGLATYMAANRIKEIGVRKVLGASVANITLHLSKDFIKLVVVAILNASPVAWWSMNGWLKGYDYRITIGAWTFIITGAGAIFIAILTVSYQSIKAAVANPVKSLRIE